MIVLSFNHNVCICFMHTSHLIGLQQWDVCLFCRFGPIEYKGPFVAPYVESFILRVITPLTYLPSRAHLEEFLSYHEVLFSFTLIRWRFGKVKFTSSFFLFLGGQLNMHSKELRNVICCALSVFTWRIIWAKPNFLCFLTVCYVFPVSCSGFLPV